MSGKIVFLSQFYVNFREEILATGVPRTVKLQAMVSIYRTMQNVLYPRAGAKPFIDLEKVSAPLRKKVSAPSHL